VNAVKVAASRPAQRRAATSNKRPVFINMFIKAGVVVCPLERGSTG
jgi:hypothetical protein